MGRDMKIERRPAVRPARVLPKCPTGIQGLDEITAGGLPRGRPTLICGATGCGKTLLAMEFLVRGAVEHGEPGVFMSFEEPADDLAANFAPLGFDLPGLVARRRIVMDHVHIERAEIEETGAYDLEGLFVRLGHAIDSIRAKRVVLDTIEALFSGLKDHAVLRAELRRLFHWLKQRGVTAVVTGERGSGDSLTRYGLEEYVADGVIVLDHRVTEHISTRRMRIVKYRGSPHGTDEYPFLIDERGISILPVTSLGLTHDVSNERISTGIAALDAMLGGKGCFRGSSVLVSGTAGSGKTSLAAHFADAACRRGERCLYFAFEESPQQIARNMRSIGIDLERWVKRGLLQFHAARPTQNGLETHLATMLKAVDAFRPAAVVADPVTNLAMAGNTADVKILLTRLIDHLKTGKITALLTSLTEGSQLEQTDVGISSLIDTWLLLRDIEIGGERNRGLYVLKSRGMAHSNQIREFRLTGHGVDLIDVYVGPGGVLTGAARAAQEAQEKAALLEREEEIARKRRARESKHAALEAQIAGLRAAFEAEEAEARMTIGDEQRREAVLALGREAMSRLRADSPPARVDRSGHGR